MKKSQLAFMVSMVLLAPHIDWEMTRWLVAGMNCIGLYFILREGPLK